MPSGIDVFTCDDAISDDIFQVISAFPNVYGRFTVNVMFLVTVSTFLTCTTIPSPCFATDCTVYNEPLMERVVPTTFKEGSMEASKEPSSFGSTYTSATLALWLSLSEIFAISSTPFNRMGNSSISLRATSVLFCSSIKEKGTVFVAVSL